MTGSRFLAPTVSKFIALETRFFMRHPKLSRFLAHIPGASKFLHLPAVATTPHVAPVYNARARRLKRPMPRP